MKRGAMKELFLLDPATIFLNHGSFGARPREVFEAQERIRLEIEARPVAFLARSSSEALSAALTELGRYLGADPANLAFVENATTGVNIAARSLDLGPGDEVLGTDHEYGACALAVERTCAARGANYHRVSLPMPYDGDEAFCERLEAALTPRTRALFLSHVTSPTALRFPVEAAIRLARSRGIPTIVDGAHAPGQIDLGLEALGADFYAGNCHKWLCGPLGSGFLYVKSAWHDRVDPPVTSWGMVAIRDGGKAHDGYAGATSLARRLQWLGTRDLSAFLAVPAALEFQRRSVTAEAAAECEDLAARTSRRAAALLGLDPIAPAAGLRMALVPLPLCDGDALKAELFDRHRIEVPVTSYGDSLFIRLSFHIYNDASDAEAFLEALGRLFPRGRAAF